VISDTGFLFLFFFYKKICYNIINKYFIYANCFSDKYGGGSISVFYYFRLDKNQHGDLFIILFFVIAAFLYGFSLGRDRIVAILVSIYMGLAVC